MTLTVRDVDGLGRELLAAGTDIVGPPGSLLRDAADWYEKKGESLGIIDRQSFAYLRECIRSEANEKTRRIAVGALVTLQRETEERPDRARFVLRFALRRIYSLSGRKIEWSGIPIPNVDVAEAQELFEVARGDSRYSDAELLSTASAFVNRFEDANDMFGRFAQDLKVLIDVLRSPTTDESHLETARAALVYLVEVADAISDDVGSVGLLDDALVVRRAVAHIQPSRSVMASYLDSVIRKLAILAGCALGGARRDPWLERVHGHQFGCHHAGDGRRGRGYPRRRHRRSGQRPAPFLDWLRPSTRRGSQLCRGETLSSV